MRRTPLFAKRLRADARGATAVEYGLILAGIVLAVFGALQTTGSSVSSLWNNVSTKVLSAH